MVSTFCIDRALELCLSLSNYLGDHPNTLFAPLPAIYKRGTTEIFIVTAQNKLPMRQQIRLAQDKPYHSPVYIFSRLVTFRVSTGCPNWGAGRFGLLYKEQSHYRRMQDHTNFGSAGFRVRLACGVYFSAGISNSPSTTLSTRLVSVVSIALGTS